MAFEPSYRDLAARYADSYPLLVNARAERRDIERSIAREIARIVGNLKGAHEVAKSQEDALRAGLTVTTGAAGLDSDLGTRLRELERLKLVDETLFETYLGKARTAEQQATYEDRDIRVISPAEVPGAQAFPNRWLVMVCLSMVGLGLGLSLGLLLDALEAGFRSARHTESELGHPVLAAVPWLDDRQRTLDGRLVDPSRYLANRPHSQYAEAVHAIRAGLRMGGRAAAQIVLVTSSGAGEGKSVLALSVALSAARGGQKVLLIDADLRAPSLSGYFGAQHRLGLVDVLTGLVGAEETTIAVSGGLSIMPAGRRSAVAPDLFGSARMAHYLTHLRAVYDLVVIDTAPAGLVVDARVLAPVSDGVIFVVGWLATAREEVLRSLRTFAAGKGCRHRAQQDRRAPAPLRYRAAAGHVVRGAAGGGVMRPASHPRRHGLFVYDAARAIAALAVLASHARSLVLLDAADQPPLSLPARIVFAATGLGHQAVVVFFVVSGALVTRSLLRMQAGVWSPADFAVARLCRLLLVLVPCLLLGALEDRLGLSGATATYGALGTSATVVADRLAVGTLVGNLAFLQGMVVPVFGSNVPLWTLSVEAWCYAGAFCVFAVGRAPRQPVQAAVCIVAFGLAAAVVLTPAFWQLVPLWAVGAASAVHRPRPGRRASFGDVGTTEKPSAGQAGRSRALALIALVGATLAARSFGGEHQAFADYALALVAAGSLTVLSTWTPRPGIAVRTLRRLADLSYSLYLSHIPLLALCASWALQGRRLPFEVGSVALATFLALVALGQATLLWAVFERHTGAVRDALLLRLHEADFDIRRRRATP